jgi:NitT/TauT family transport system ATP-binding protein
MLAIDIDRVSKEYKTGQGTLSALADCSFSVARGEFVSVVGPSGCGKSTLLRIVGGLDNPSSGSVRLHDTVVSGPSPVVSMVFQNPVLLPWRRVIDQLLLVPELRYRDRKKDHVKTARALLERVGLNGFEDAYPKQLSGGMAQRCAIARALMGKGDILLLDEPFGALDALTRESMNVWLGELCAGAGRTALLITHDIDEAILLSDRIIVMSPRPGTVLAEYKVPLARPRMPAEVIKAAAAVQLRADIRQTLAMGVAGFTDLGPSWPPDPGKPSVRSSLTRKMPEVGVD